MTIIRLINLTLLLPLLLGAQSPATNLQTITIDGLERKYILHVPESLQENASLVMVFHGYSGSATGVLDYFDLRALANQHGFLLVHPQGTIDQEGYSFWQKDYSSHRKLKVDDVSFITQLASYLQETYKLNKANTFISGFSNGGDLCNKLVCETQGLFKAAAPVISCLMLKTYDRCKNAQAVPILMLNGTHDKITHWAGDVEDKQGYGGYHSTDTMLEFRVAQAGCELTSTSTIESPDSNNKTSITLKKFANKETGNQVWMYQYNNGGHGHPDYLNLENEVWNFFSMYIE